MSQNNDGQEDHSSLYSGLNTIQYLRIRKELITLQLDVERRELWNTWIDIQGRSIYFNYLNVLIALIYELSKGNKPRKSVNIIKTKLNNLSRKYLIFKSLIPLIFMRAIPSLLRYRLRYRIGTLLKFIVFGSSSWITFQVIKHIQSARWNRRKDEGCKSRLKISNTPTDTAL
ncbi:MAG: hypothetical protein REV35_03405 [Burkholderia sp.]|nr:hypothetical protein [Burkholderia sp.]